jgi:hypothetical protein
MLEMEHDAIAATKNSVHRPALSRDATKCGGEEIRTPAFDIRCDSDTQGIDAVNLLGNV